MPSDLCRAKASLRAGPCGSSTMSHPIAYIATTSATVAQCSSMGASKLPERFRSQVKPRPAAAVAPTLPAIATGTPRLNGSPLSAALLATAPGLAAFASPLLIGLVLAAPLASLTADPRLGRWLARHRICAIPEELAPPPEVAAVIDLPRAAAETGAPAVTARGPAASGLAASDPPEATG